CVRELSAGVDPPDLILTAITLPYTLSLHDALPIYAAAELWHLLVGAVRLTGDLPVDRLELDSPLGTIGADELDWSLPSLPELLSEGGCAEITGADVATVLDALAAGGGELLESEPWRLSARTLPPGMPAC